jgi:cytochrome o ubiquinol oxidase subunit IV
LLTLAAPGFIWLHGYLHHAFPTHAMLGALFVVLALLQLFVQLVFFLHLGKEASPRWNLLAFSFAAIVVVIVVGGTLWIMYDLDHNMQMQMNQEYNVFEEENIFPNASLN